jgi:hypothetical protein
LSGSGIESDIKQKQVEALPLGKSMKPEAHFSFSEWVVHRFHKNIKKMDNYGKESRPLDKDIV